MDQLVTCSGLDCSVCSFLESASFVFRWLLGLSAALAVLALIIGGLVYLLNKGNKGQLQRAKTYISYVIVGFVFTLIAFISVHTIIWFVGGKNFKSWWKFECNVNIITETLNKSLPETDYLKNISFLQSELEDEASLLASISSLSELSNSDYKAASLNLENLDPESLRQDLLTLNTGEQIKFLAGAADLNPEELLTFLKMQNGYSDDSTDKYNFADLSNKFQELVNFSRDDGDLTVNGQGVLSSLSGTFGGTDPQTSIILDKLQGLLSKRTNQSIIAYKNARSEGTLSSCIDTGGDWKEFRNECAARRQIYGKQNIKCSPINNPTMGCVCPRGNSLVGGACIKNKELNDPAAIEKIIKNENPASCSGKSLIERVCPATRCEGANLVTYPQSGADQCEIDFVKRHSCAAVKSQYNATCDQLRQVPGLADKENIAKKNSNTYSQLKDFFDRGNPSNSPDNWGTKGGSRSGTDSGGNDGGGRTGGGNTSGDPTGAGGGDKTGGDRTGGGDKTGGDRTGGGGKTGGDKTGGDQTSEKPPSELGPGNYNPTPSASALAECIGFKDGKIPYNGVLVTLLNKDDPTNAKHPSNNASRLFYLDRYGNLIGNSGDKNAGGLKVGPWTKGSGGSAWTPEWVIFNAQTTHSGGSGADKWSFKSGQGYRVGSNGEGMNANGSLNPDGKPQNMSGCNMHSGNSRSHSKGCMTMGGNERKGLTDYVKKMATQSGGNIMMAVLPAENTDQNSQTIRSDYCGNMNPDAAVNKFKTLSQYRNYDPMQGY